MTRTRLSYIQKLPYPKIAKEIDTTNCDWDWYIWL